ncbi:MAG: MFS transporter [Asgard group archaeon]|nr:MFS transporter [Asgard group archaeon]
MRRFPYGRTTLLSTGYFTSSLTWSVYNVYVPLFARANLIAVIGNKPIINTLVGVIMILDNFAALFLQPYIGELSDRTWIPKLGRRMPFIMLGIPLAAIFFGLIGNYHDIFYMLLISIIGFNICMAFYKTPVMSLIPDNIPTQYRSQGSGVLNVVGGLANLTGLLVSSYFYKYYSPKVAFWVISAIMIVCLVILVLGVRERKDVEIEKSEERIKILKSLKNMFTETDKTLLFVLFAVFFANAGYYVGETFLSSYVSVVLGFSDYAAAVMLGVFFVFAVLSAIPAGFIGRRIGPINASLIGVVGFIVGITPIAVISIVDLELMRKILTLNYLTFGWEAVLYSFIIAGIGFCYILASINKIVVIWDLAPQKRIATYIGYFYVFTSLAAIVSPFIAGMIFDFVSYLSGKTGLKSLFVYVACAFCIALIFVSRVKILFDKELKENRDRVADIKEERREIRKRTMLLESLLFGQILRIRATRKLRRLQRKEIQELKEDYSNAKKDKIDFKDERREMRKSHREERDSFRKQEET